MSFEIISSGYLKIDKCDECGKGIKICSRSECHGTSPNGGLGKDKGCYYHRKGFLGGQCDFCSEVANQEKGCLVYDYSDCTQSRSVGGDPCNFGPCVWKNKQCVPE